MVERNRRLHRLQQPGRPGLVARPDGKITVKQYQNLFYRDSFHYTRERLGPDRITTARPADSMDVLGYKEYAPADVNVAGWVGDQTPNFAGLGEALNHMFKSAEYKAINFSSDIGGYEEEVDREKTLFVRWTQLGAFCPVMENGGKGEHRPWTFDDEVLTIYRDFVKLHHALIPYLYSEGAERWPAGVEVPTESVTRDIYEEDGLGETITANYAADRIEITVSPTVRSHAFVVMNTEIPTAVLSCPSGELTPVDDRATLLARDAGWYFDDTTNQLWVKPGDATGGLALTIQ